MAKAQRKAQTILKRRQAMATTGRGHKAPGSLNRKKSCPELKASFGKKR